MVRAVQRAI